MRKSNRIFQSISPELNGNLLTKTLEEVAFNDYYPTERIVTILATVPSMAMPNEDKDYFLGYRTATLLAQACLYRSLDNDNSDMMAHMILSQIMDRNLSLAGERFLDSGRRLLLRDMSGKRMMSKIVTVLKDSGGNKSFCEGVEDARSLFESYWKEFEKRGLNYTDLPAPPKR